MDYLNNNGNDLNTNSADKVISDKDNEENNEINNEVNNEVNNEINSEVNIEANNEVKNEVNNEGNNEVGIEANNEATATENICNDDNNDLSLDEGPNSITSGNGGISEAASSFHSSSAKEKNGSNSDNLRASSFYSESYKKPPKKRFSLMQLITVGLVCSILGGTVSGGVLTIVAPTVQPVLQKVLANVFPGSTTYYANNNDSGVIKKYEIEQTTSPVVAIAEKVSPSVVGIRATFPSGNFIFQQTNAGSEGSGIIIREDGYIITNNHVISPALDSRGKIAQGCKIEVFLPGEKNRAFEAEVIGNDERTDLAVLKINAKGLPAAELGDSDKIKVGDLAVAIGNPAGMNFMGSVTSGIISGLDRPMDNMNELNMIQTDASINEGNSGGALCNSQGQVIGINTLKIGNDGFEGMGFSIPINKAKEIIDSLITSGYVKGRPPVLNVTVDLQYTPEVAEYYGWPEGVYVKSVVNFGAAYRAGIQAHDIITHFDGKRVKNYDELNELRAKHKAGDKVKVQVYRDGENKTFEVTLEEDRN